LPRSFAERNVNGANVVKNNKTKLLKRQVKKVKKDKNEKFALPA